MILCISVQLQTIYFKYYLIFTIMASPLTWELVEHITEQLLLLSILAASCFFNSFKTMADFKYQNSKTVILGTFLLLYFIL